MGTQRAHDGHRSGYAEPAQSSTAWLPEGTGHSRAAGGYDYYAGANPEGVARACGTDPGPMRVALDRPGSGSNPLFVDDDDMLLMRYRELMSV
jgi:hypothetical protein